MNGERLGNILGYVEAEELVVALGDALAVVETSALGEKLGDVQAKVLVNTLADTVAKVKAVTLGDKQSDEEADALLKTLAKTQEDVEVETVGDVEAEGLFNTVADRATTGGERDPFQQTERCGTQGTSRRAA